MFYVIMVIEGSVPNLLTPSISSVPTATLAEDILRIQRSRMDDLKRQDRGQAPRVGVLSQLPSTPSITYSKGAGTNLSG